MPTTEIRAQLVESSWLRRTILVSTPEGEFRVRYIGTGAGEERVEVNGEFHAGGRSAFWFIPRFEFEVGTLPAVLSIRVWPWLTLRALVLTVDGRLVYEE